MQGLCATEHGGESLICGTRDIIVRLLCGQRRARRLGMETQHHGTWVLRMETVAHDMGPHAASSTELGDFLKQVVVAIKEERKLARETIHIQSCVNGCLHIRDRISEREGHLLHGS